MPEPSTRVHVQEGEIALAQRHEVTVGAEVGLDLDRLALADDVEGERALLAGDRGLALDPDLVAGFGVGLGLLERAGRRRRACREP